MQSSTDGSVLPGPPKAAAAACVAPQLGVAEQRKLASTSSPTTAELLGLHLTADPLADHTEEQWAIILRNSRATLLRLTEAPRTRDPRAAAGPKAAQLERRGAQYLPAPGALTPRPGGE